MQARLKDPIRIVCAVCMWRQVFDDATMDTERDGITTCYNTLQQGVATAADMDDVDVKFRHVVEVAVSSDACCAAAVCWNQCSAVSRLSVPSLAVTAHSICPTLSAQLCMVGPHTPPAALIAVSQLPGRRLRGMQPTGCAASAFATLRCSSILLIKFQSSNLQLHGPALLSGRLLCRRLRGRRLWRRLHWRAGTCPLRSMRAASSGARGVPAC